MDFDLSKENIQPLRGGRNVSQLGVALQAQTDMDHQKELTQQKSEYEKLIRTYTGDDPLENWYNYISWVEQSYPKQGHEGNLVSLLEHCLKLFENDEKYREDRRLCKLFIKYFDQHQNPLELYHMMYVQGLCRSCADMYKAWAYYYEAASDYQSAHHVLECGKRELAQPFEDLQNAHENLVFAAGQHIIYGPNVRNLSEKRQVLTSLHAYKPGQVGSIRNTTHSNAGTLGAVVAPRSNASIFIYEDKGEEIRGAEAGPTSIVTAAKLQEVPKENTLKPGPWTTLPVKKKGPVQRCTPAFTVHEDGGDDGDNLKTNTYVSATSENYSDWIVSLTIPEPKDDKMVPRYPKARVYSEISTEYSLEELRATRYLSKKNRLVRESAEVNQAVQSILVDDDSIINYLPSKIIEKDKCEQMSHQSTPSEHFPSYEQNPTKISTDASADADHLEMRTECEKPAYSTNTWYQKSSQVCSPSTSSSEHLNPNLLNFDLWNSFTNDVSNVSINVVSKPNVPKFAIYEQSNLALQEQIEPKGSAMKTPFKDLNAEELAETGSRGGMDIAAAAPVDSAKRLPLYDDDSSSSFEKMSEPISSGDLSCNTQMFGFNLNVMQVSTPQNKQSFSIGCGGDSAKIAPKQLFAETLKEDEKCDKVLSTIFEETKSYGHSSSSSSGNVTTKSSLMSNRTKQNNLEIIYEDHNGYLAQNLMANAALRSSSLGDLMDFGHQSPNSVAAVPKSSAGSNTPNMIPVAPTEPVAPTTITPLTFVPSDPFKQTLIEKLLQKVCFPGRHTQGYFCLNNIPKLTVRKESICIGSDKYVIEKQLGKGTYGTVFRGIDVRTGNTVAIKFQKPANKWEFYICRELRSRLVLHDLRERFMDVKIGYFSDQASVLISEFMPCGSLLDVANMVKQKSGRPMKESLCIHFCLEMLKVVQAMHEMKIIHADIKPDNFLVQLFPNDAIGLQLIDFGCSIDMSLFPSNASFTRKVTTEDFICCEMIDNRPWNYHTDLFCIAATAHVLLFEKYIQLQKKDGHWSISNRLPRYARVDLWNMFFSTLLNQQEGPADSASLQAMLEDGLNHKFDDYYNEIRSLTNILKNR